MNSLGIFRPLLTWRRPGGIALVLVLSVIAIVATLVLSFLIMTHTESRAGKAFSDAADARNLAELPVNLAIAQIRRATEQNGVNKTWSSQPGMLRVYGTEADNTTANSDKSYSRAKAVALYKLYSDDQMVVTKSGATATTNGMTTTEINSALQTDISDLSNWQTVPGMFVDMNEPAPVVLSGSSNVQIEFPITDPRALFPRNGGQAVDGFSFDETKIPGTKKPTSDSDLAARLPMPVRWLYLLSDGRLVAPTGGDATTGLKFQATDTPSTSNPIVGRIAFWTDDDSCKVNINTATEGRPWDVPRAHSQTEVNFANRMPVQNEFSQYPGHPAQTCLSPVFQAFSSDWLVSPSMSDATMQQSLKRYFDFSPRIPWGGSMGATTTTSGSSTTAITTVKDARLYTSVDEMVFTRDRLPQNPVLDQQDVRIGRFFLTANSRAPELTLFNKPRLMLWPLSSNTTQRNAEDKLLAFLGSTLGHPWPLVTRLSNWTSSTSPGSSSTSNQELILSGSSTNRNTDMYVGMLQPYTGMAENGKTYPVPGFGGTFEQKWGAQRRNQILTEIWDFNRWSVNSYSTASGLSPTYYYLPWRVYPNLGETSATPTICTDNKTRGFGRFPTVLEAVVVFVATAKDSSGKATKMQAYIILEPFSPTCGPPSWTPNVRYKISGLDSFQADGKGMGFPASAINHCTVANGWVDGGHSTPFNGIGHQFKLQPNGTNSAKTLGTADEVNQFPFTSTAVDITGKTQFAFSGGSITLEIQTGWGATGTTVQTLHMTFPSATLKVPSPATDMDLVARFNNAGTDYNNRLIEKGDITRSVEIASNDTSSTPKNDNPAKGDLRLLCLMSDVPASWFTTHPSYKDTSIERLHFLRLGSWTAGGQYGPPDPAGVNGPIGVDYTNTHPNTRLTGGTLLKGMEYGRDSPPGVPRGTLGAINADGRPGDFDNGTGIIEDGPYINKADEGNIATPNGGYMTRTDFSLETGVSYSPNRQITSAVAFGSLPTGVSSYDQATANNAPAFRPWQTLLFCPNPASRSTASTLEPVALDHEGFKSPRDHLLLDLFWMPIVEPYAISDTFSTAGKINMNYQMLPFTHIERSTGIYAALKPVCLTAITPKSVRAVGAFDSGHQSGENYKEGTTHNYELRYLVNAKETLKGFQARFNMGDAFRSASEICEIFLVPQRIDGHTYNSDAATPPTYDGMSQWWNGDLNTIDAFDATGDNSREAPYNGLYPRLTTKSNTYTVHFRVQSLKKARSTPANTWIEGKDSVLSEYRGSSTLERYMDPNDLQVTNIGMGYATFNLTWDTLYRFRIVDRKRFAP